MKLLSRLEKRKDVWFLLSCLCLFLLLRLPSLFEPNWYGDEGIYQTIGYALNNGRILYAGIWDNKPPLLYILYAFLHADQFLIRFASIVSGLAAIVVFYLLSRNLFKTQKIAAITTTIFSILFALPFLEGNIANAENFMLLPILLAGYLIFTVSTQTEIFPSISEKLRQNKPIIYAISGLLLSLAFLFKIVAIFDTAAFSCFLFFMMLPKRTTISLATFFRPSYVLSVGRRLLPFFFGFITPIVGTILYFLFVGAFTDYIQAAFLSNISYVGYNNDIFFPHDLLLFKVCILLGVLWIIAKKRAVFSDEIIFLSLWGIFSLFDLFFSQRPYVHYLLVFLPVFSLSWGLLFIHQKLQKQLTLVGIILTIILSFYFKLHPIKYTVMYYTNFLSFISNQKTLASYMTFFDRVTLRDQHVSEYLKSHTQKNATVLLWGNSAQIYVLSYTLPPGKYTVAYHIAHNKKAIAEMNVSLKKNPPVYIAIFPDQAVIPFSLSNYHYKITIDEVAIYEKRTQ